MHNRRQLLELLGSVPVVGDLMNPLLDAILNLLGVQKKSGASSIDSLSES